MLKYVLSVILIIACIIIAIQSYTSAIDGPPGPKGYPFFGVIFEVDILKLHEKLYEWTQQYGDVFQFQMLGKKFLCINSVDVLRETFLKEPCVTIRAARPPTFIGKYVIRNYTDVIFALLSPSWAKRRKFVHRLLHTYGKGTENQVLQNLLYFKGKVEDTNSANVNPFEILDEFILSTIETLKEDCEEKGIYHTLKEAMEEKDENREPCIYEDNIYGILFNRSYTHCATKIDTQVTVSMRYNCHVVTVVIKGKKPRGVETLSM